MEIQELSLSSLAHSRSAPPYQSPIELSEELCVKNRVMGVWGNSRLWSAYYAVGMLLFTYTMLFYLIFITLKIRSTFPLDEAH